MASLFLTSSFLDVTSIAKSSDLISGSALTDVSLMPDSSVDLETTIRITLSEMMTASMTSMLEISPIETYVIENDTSALTPGMDTSIYASDSVMSQSITLSLTDTSTLINPVPKSSVLVTDDTVSPEETWSESVSITVSLSDVMTVSTSLVRPDMVPSLSDAPSTDLSIVTSMPNDMSSSSMFTDPFQLTLVSSFSTRLPIISLSTELVATLDSTISYSPPIYHTTTEGLDTSRIDILLVSSSMNFISSLTELPVTTSNMEVSSLFGISTEQQTSSVQTSSMNDFTDAFNTSTEKLTATLTTSIISFHSVSSQLSEELIVLNSPSVDFSTVSSTYTETLTEVSSFVDFPRTSRIALESFSQTEMDDSNTGFSGVSSTFSAELMESIISSSGFSSAYSFSKDERTDFDLFSSSAYSSSEERPVITITKLVTDFMSNVTIRSQSLSTLLSVDTDNETVHLEVTSDYDFTHDLHPTTLISDVHFSSSVTILGVVDTWYSSVLSVGSSRVLEPTSTLELDVSSTLSSSYILFEDLSNASLSYTSASQSSLTMLVLTSFSYASDAIANITSDMRTDVHPGDVVLSSSNIIISDTVSPTLTEHYLTQILSTLWPSFSESSSLIAVSYYYSSVSAMETLSATLDVPVYSSENVSTEIKASWTDDISGTSQFLSFSTYIIHTSNLMDFSTSFLTSRPISITSEWSLEYSDPVPSSADVTLSVINSSQSTVEDTPDSFLVSPEIVSPSVKSTDMMSVETLYTTLDSSQVYQDLQTQDIITSGQDFFTTFSHSEIFMNFSDDSSSKFVLSSMPSYTPTESMSLSKSLSELQSLEEVSISISTFLMSLSPESSSRTSDYRESLTTAAVESSPSIVTNTFFPSYLASDVSAVQESYPTSVNQTEEWTIYTDLISSVGHLPSQTSLNPLIPLTTVALDPSLPGENLTVAGTSTLSASNLFVASRTDFSDSESMVESISSMTSTVQFVSTMAEYSLTTSMVSVLSVETVLTSMQPHQSEITLSYNDTDSSIISWSASKEIPLESSHFLESSYISDRASSNISDLTSYISDMASYTSDMTSYISDRASSNISDMTSSYISDMTSYTSDMTSYTSDMTSYTSDMTSYTSDMTPYISDWASSNISDWASSNISDMTSSYISDMTSYTSDMTSYISDMTSYISDMTSSYISDMTSAYISDMTSYTTDMTSYTSNMTSYTSDIISYISDRTSSNISDMTSAYISDMTSHTFNDLSSLVSSPFPEGTSAFTEYITFHISTDTSSVTMSDITLSTSLTSDYFSSLNTSSVSLYPTVQDSSYYTLSEVSTSKSLFPDLLTSSFTIQSIWPSVNWTDTSVGSMSSSLSDITLTFSNSISESLNWSISTGGFIEPTLTYTDSISTTEVVIQNSSSLLIVTSVTSEFTLSPTTLSSVLPSSSIIPTVPPTTGPTVPNIENSKNKTEFWVVTKFKVRPSVDIQAREFKNGLEKGLANAYALSKIRNEEKINGTYVPLKKRKRASVSDMDNTVQVEIVSLTRPDTLTVDATYVVQENGQIVPAQQVSDQLNLLSSQEMAIQTGQVVTQTAQPYITAASSEDNTKWIILGSVLGGVLVLAIFFFILCCCCGRCCQAKGKDNQVAMEAVKTYVSDEPAARRKSFAFASKKGKYSVSTEKEDDPLYASIKPSMKANKKKDVTQPAENNQEETDMEEKPGKKIRQDTPQKKRRKKALDTNEELRSVYESQMASLQTKTFSSEEYTLTSQPTVEEEGDLLENAEEERKKNKQRLREKKKSEQGALSHPANLTTNVYESAQHEIDKVLGPRLSHDSEDGHEKKQEKKRKKKAKKGKENEAFVPDEPKGETLEEARERMHKLLDDAFSLISHSKSSISNKVQPVDSSDAYSSSTSKYNTPRQDHSVQADLDSSASEEKKHTPINVQRTHEPYDSSGLITWSPYRASDEIATISLPSTQTNLSSQPPQQEKLTTSTFVETAPSRKNSYLATEPGKPIVIKTKNFEDSLPPPGPQKHKGFNGNPAQHSSDIRTRQETFQNPVYENTLPLRTMETYSEPYHGLASYQDLPVSHLAGKVSNGRPHVRQSAWQEERSKLADMAPLSLNASPRDVIDVRSHTGPQHGEKKHFDEVDVITESLRPGASPQPLINSLRDELQSLSSKRQTGPTKHTNQSGSSETKRLKDYLPSQLNTSQAESESSWGSMHRNTSKV
uniref:SEA domain-containing protein n=1 Tax=Biomphalaria glabrata TaxID=6526 RepID=A0A2C9JXQ4_BIOGL